jgi:hypothetical protein
MLPSPGPAKDPRTQDAPANAPLRLADVDRRHLPEGTLVTLREEPLRGIARCGAGAVFEARKSRSGLSASLPFSGTRREMPA